MSVNTDFIHEVMKFLHRSFPDDLGPQDIVERADILVYGLATKLCSQIGTQTSFNDWAASGRGGTKVPHGPPPPPPPRRRLDALVAYAEDAACISPEMAETYRDAFTSLPR